MFWAQTGPQMDIVFNPSGYTDECVNNAARTAALYASIHHWLTLSTLQPLGVTAIKTRNSRMNMERITALPRNFSKIISATTLC